LACALRRVLGADLMVVDQPWLARHEQQNDAGWQALAPLLEPTYADAAVAIFRLRPSEAECPPMRVDVGAHAP
jgi:hypothetical protein